MTNLWVETCQLTSHKTRQRTAGESVAAAFIRAAVLPLYRRKLKRFEAMTHRARDVQREALMRKIKYCADSRFGRQHSFSAIGSIKDFRRNVPISHYEDLASYITAAAAGRPDALFPPGEKIVAFASTTGTTGTPKLNPVTRTWLNEYRRGWEIWGIKALIDHPATHGLKTLSLGGASELGATPGGLPIHMASAITAKYQNPIMRSFYATPGNVADIKDPDDRYYTILRLALPQSVGMIVSVTAGNLLRLAETGRDQAQDLIRDLYDGSLRRGIDLPPAIGKSLQRALKMRHRTRAKQLEQLIERRGALVPRDYWPIGLIACWLGGTVGYRSGDLGKFYGDTPQRDLGLVSTEGRHSIPFDDSSPDGVLAVDGSFYEFIPVDDVASSQPTVLEGWELRPGADYYVLVTTSSGLYRYNLDDIIRCKGFKGEAPVMEFLNKASCYSDMEGEKLSGYQVAQTVQQLSRDLGISLGNITAVPIRPLSDEPPYYAMAIEADRLVDDALARVVLQSIDSALIRQNVMYASKRNDRYIGPPRLLRLAPGSWAEFVATEAARRGTGEVQFKHPSLVSDSSWLDRFDIVDAVSGGGTAR